MNAQVVFATVTGNNEKIADIICRKLKKLGVNVKEIEMFQADADEFQHADIGVICSYTDEGYLPDEGADFCDDLERLDLSGLVFGVAGSGDPVYREHYNSVVDDLSEMLNHAHATQGSDNVKIKLTPNHQDAETLNQFASQLVKVANKIKQN
ncbi:flavodoxin [Philodulcilactobacillus myokoensis]|uniref:Flavodoxin n=1 Tax=Philodulcilactobacillus myokoensis TaxID=2929573 RepID=A0A9W6B0J3_9LACO|nr:flavodoxin domain-containing protein [Philodulcilactobacillus myokoensis]GLB46228.1 flavodoxin [Philodulcilactobacillus myokoensis]